MPSIEQLRRYCRIPPDGDADPILAQCLKAAELYMTNAGVKPPAEDNELYDLAVYMLAEQWYDARGTETIGAVAHAYGRAVQQIILQLRADVEVDGE